MHDWSAQDPTWESRVEVLQLDVTSDASVTAAAASLLSRFGPKSLYGLVNNAGTASEEPRALMGINLHSVKRVVDAFVPLIAADGRNVNVSSGAGALPVGLQSAVRPFAGPANLSASSLLRAFALRAPVAASAH